MPKFGCFQSYNKMELTLNFQHKMFLKRLIYSAFLISIYGAKNLSLGDNFQR